MTEERPQFARVARLDAAGLVDRLAAQAGVRLEIEGHSSGGQVGAAYVRWPDGHRSVLTYVPAAALARARETARNVEFARNAGVPAPRYELVADLGDDVAIVQELLPGRPPATADVGLIEEMLAANRRLYGVLAGTDFAPVPLHLTESGPAYCLHEPLQSYSARSRRLLDWIREVGRTVPPTMSGEDLVHVDYHPDNVLVSDDGALSGVVDWDGAARGDARFAMVVMRFTGPPGRLAPDVAHRIDSALDEALSPDELRPYWAELSLRMVDWSIRHFPDELTERWLDFTDTQIG